MAVRRTELQMHSWLVAPLLARIRESGGDPAALIRKFDLPADAERAEVLVLSLAALEALFEEGERLAGDPDVGLHLGETLGRGTFGVVEFVCLSSPTVRVGLDRLSRYHALLNDIIVVSVRDEDADVIVEHKIPGRSRCVGRHANEFFVAHLLSQARRLTGRPFVPRAAFFAHAAPVRTTEHQRVTGTRVRTDVTTVFPEDVSGATSLIFDERFIPAGKSLAAPSTADASIANRDAVLTQLKMDGATIECDAIGVANPRSP